MPSTARRPRRSTHPHPPRTTTVTAAALLLAVFVPGCGDQPRPVSCEQLLAPSSGAASDRAVTLIADVTADFPPATLSTAAHSRLRSEIAHDATINLVLLQGPASAPTYLVRDAAPLSGQRAPRRRQHRTQQALECLNTTITHAAASSAGTDVLGTLHAAAGAVAAKRHTIVVVSNGLSNTAPLDLNQIAIGERPPRDVVAALAAAGAAPDLRGARVHFSGLTVTQANRPVAATVRNWLTELYRELCKAGNASDCTVDTAIGRRTTAAPSTVADPPVGLPGPETVRLPSKTVHRLQAGVLFDGDSATLRPAADELLRPIAHQVRTRSDATALVEGHTAGGGDPADRQALSRRRARAVADRLIALGADPAALTTVGHGSARRRVNDTPNGRLTESAARTNRRVEITVTPRTSH